MRKLEQEPKTYDEKFTSLTRGVNLKVQEWVLNRINSSESILEVGCGTGALSSKIALKGNDVIAIDKNPKMINFAMRNYPTETEVKLLYQIGSFIDFPIESRSKDVIVSTFMLSELRPLEQQIFLRNAWKALKPNGRLILADEFVPSGFWRFIFGIKSWWYKKKLGRLRSKLPFQINWFFNYIEPIGYKIVTKKEWTHGSIKAIELQKVNDNKTNEPGFYRPKPRKFKGIRSQLRVYRCLFTGQVDRVPIEPGIYQSGTPSKSSPIIVTANYEYTYIKVMRNLKGLDAWVVCVDSNGINVWCAARGDDFGNKQLIEVVEATEIKNLNENKTLILPQLAAGGVAVPQLPKNSEKFPFRVTYGPIWSKDLPQFLENRPARKPDSMKIAKFTMSHRIRAGITHITFLLRKIFLLPLIGLLIVFLVLNWLDKLILIVQLFLWIIVTNLIISILFPLSKFTRSFIKKGIFFGTINLIVLGGLTWLFHGSIVYVLWNLCFYFWIAFFSTMSFSGYTMSTNPREIQVEYPIFSKINSILLIIALVSLFISIIIY